VRKTGTAVRTYGPWAVVDPGGDARFRFVVVDTSATPRPVRVHGPTSRKECETWAHTSMLLLAATHGQLPGPLEER
jgi:hypothetical protein